MIAHGANVDERDREGRLPLEVAIKAKNIAAIMVLVGKGANLNLKPSDSNNFTEYLEIIKFENEKDKNFVSYSLDPTNLKEISEGVQEGERQSAEIEKQKSVEANRIKDREKYEELRQAALGAHLEDFKALLSKGYKPEVGHLLTAVHSNHGDLKDRLEICNLIIANNVSVNDRDNDILPAEEAIKALNPETLEWLIKNGADLSLVSSHWEGSISLFELAKNAYFLMKVSLVKEEPKSLHY
ncbi:MAG: hypothetical protein HWD61_05945 [Parachlamydiaceae bacterium]|nr:MAG: hypothetical protein HWD61_05945 [Parachlamydiaceae bacterium]